MAKKLPTMTPQQQQIQNQILQLLMGQLGGGGFLQGLLGGETGAFEAPARRQFEEQTIPSIAERFSALGAQGSSAFGQTLGQAGAGLEEALSAQRGQMGLQGLGALLGAGFQPSFAYQQRQPGFLEQAGMGILQSLPQLGALAFL